MISVGVELRRLEDVGVRLEVDGRAVAAERADLFQLAGGLPRLKVCCHSKPSRRMVATSLRDRALTTDEPTPCRPPEWM